MKTIGILTSGGDAPGMNAAIRAVLRYSIYKGISVKGILEGYKGLMEGKIIDMELSSVADIIHRGGTILKSARSKEFLTKKGQKKAINILKVYNIDGLVVIGGDGSLKGAKELNKLGVPTIGIPGTIDNDLGYTDYTLGFDTVINTVVDAISKIRDTTESHDRVSIVEVMGRNTGDIAIYAGLAGGGDNIIVPEIPIATSEIFRKLLNARHRGKLHSIILFAEGVKDITPYGLGEKIEEIVGMETRVTILGHLQRGGSPSAIDRIMASKFGKAAVELLIEGSTSRMVGYKAGEIVDVDIEEGLKVKKDFKNDDYNLIKILSI